MTTLRLLLCALSSITWHACGENAWNWKYWSTSIMISAHCCRLLCRNVFMFGPCRDKLVWKVIPDCLQVPTGSICTIWEWPIYRRKSCTDIRLWHNFEEIKRILAIPKYPHVIFWTSSVERLSVWVPLSFPPQGMSRSLLPFERRLPFGILATLCDWFNAVLYINTDALSFVLLKDQLTPDTRFICWAYRLFNSGPLEIEIEEPHMGVPYSWVTNADAYSTHGPG